MSPSHPPSRAPRPRLRSSFAARPGRVGTSSVVLVALVFTHWLSAQSDPASLLPGFGAANPAYLENHRLTLDLGTVDAASYSSDADLETLLGHFGLARARAQDRPSQAVGAARTVLGQQSVQTLQLTYRPGARLQVRLAHHLRARQYLRYPAALTTLLAHGTAYGVTEPVALDPLVDLFAYQDYSLSLAVRAEAKLQLGLRLHYYTGGAALFTERHRVAVAPSPDGRYYPVATDLRVHTSGLGTQPARPRRTGPARGAANRGIGLDFGAVFTPRPGLTISASLQGMGHIQWLADARLHRSQGRYQVRGVPYHPNGTEPSTKLGDALEQLSKALEVETEPAPFRTTLPSTAALDLHYTPNARLETAVSLSGVAYRGRFFPRLRTSVGTHFGNGLRAGLFLSTVNFDQLQVGFQGSVRLGVCSIYLAVDHAPAILRPLRSRAGGGRLGMRFAFGEVKTD